MTFVPYDQSKHKAFAFSDWWASLPEWLQIGATAILLAAWLWIALVIL